MRLCRISSLGRGALPCALLATAATAQEPAFPFQSFVLDGDLGASVAFAGDVDGDGYIDVIVGSPGEGALGHAYVYSGAHGATLHNFQGVDQDGRFGHAVDGAGDVDLDGFPDVIVSAPYGTDIAQAGRSCVFSGLTGAVLHNVVGGAAGDELGTAVAGIGDVDGDGCADFALGAPGFDSTTEMDAGCVMVRSGLTGAVLYSVIGNGRYGSSLCATDDADLDLIGDWATGAPAANGGFGRIEHRSGIDGTLLFGVDGTAAEDFGTAIGRVGDVDGDGRGDIAIGFPGHDGPAGADCGKVAVCAADGTSLGSFLGGSAGERLGTVVGPGGDLDQDGAEDVLVGTPFAAGGNGKVVICSIPTGGPVWSRIGSGGGYGAAVAGGVDFHGGGYADVLVGAPDAITPYIGVAGGAYLYTPKDLHLYLQHDVIAPGGFLGMFARGGRPVGPSASCSRTSTVPSSSHPWLGPTSRARGTGYARRSRILRSPESP